MNPTIKLFREKFYEGDRNSVYCREHNVYATPSEIEQFLLSEIQKSTQLGYDVGKEDGIAHGMMMSEKEVYKKAREEVIDEVEKWAEERECKECECSEPKKWTMNRCVYCKKVGVNQMSSNDTLTDLQHHISKMRDNKTDV